MDGERIVEVRDSLKPEDFHLQAHSAIWMRLCEMRDAGEHTDRVMLAGKLKGTGELDLVGGISGLLDLEEGMPRDINLEAYVKSIRQKAIKRSAITKCNDYMIRLAQTNEDAASVFADAETSMAALNGELADKSGFVTPLEVITEAGGLSTYLQARRKTGLQSPWPQFNRLTGGLRPGNMVVLAAQTGGGKTALAMNYTFFAGIHGHATAVFSLEMDERELNDRLICVAGQLDGRILRRSERDPAADLEKQSHVRAAANCIANLPIFISANNTTTVPGMAAQVRKLKQTQKVELVVVDYLQLVSGVGRFGTRAEEVSSISRGLKRLAMDEGVAVLALSQFKRGSAQEKRKPELYDLKESGSLEQDADLVMFIHMNRSPDVNAGIETGDAELLIPKQRGGPTGWIPIQFHGPSGIFREIEGGYE